MIYCLGMGATYKTEGIVLGRWDWREQDRMVRFFTRDYGKLTTRAISARKPRAKLAGHLEPFLYTDLFLAKSKTIDIIAGSNTISSHARLRQSLTHNALACFFSDVVDSFTHEREPDERLFEFVHDFFRWLNETDEPNALSVYAAILQLFGLLGYHLELSACHQCHKPISQAVNGEENRFSYKLWTVECASCRTEDQVHILSDNAVKVLRYMLSEGFSGVGRLHLEKDSWQEVDQFVRSLLRYHAEYPLDSESVFVSLLSKISKS